MAKDRAPTEPMTPKALRTKWKTLVLICSECATCKDGTKPKDVRRRLKKALREERPRVRVIRCGCLGICPKAGVTTVVCGPEGGPVCRVVREEKEIEGIAVPRSPDV